VCVAVGLWIASFACLISHGAVVLGGVAWTQRFVNYGDASASICKMTVPVESMLDGYSESASQMSYVVVNFQCISTLCCCAMNSLTSLDITCGLMSGEHDVDVCVWRCGGVGSTSHGLDDGCITVVLQNVSSQQRQLVESVFNGPFFDSHVYITCEEL
jgi:hypothetical protein